MLLNMISFAQLSVLSDEFNRTCSIGDWNDVEVVEGWRQTHLESFDVKIAYEG